MALWIRYHDQARNKQLEVQWHVGKVLTLIDAEDVVSVQADGHELEKVLAMGVHNLPMTNSNRFQRWYGDHARFVIGNLQLVV